MKRTKSILFLIGIMSLVLLNPLIMSQVINNSKDSTFYILKNKEVSSYWVPNGTVVSNASGVQGATTTLIDNDGNIWVPWGDTRQDGGDIYAQKLSGSGESLWNFNGNPIHNDNNVSWYPMMVLDGTGGAIITWQDDRTGQDEVYVQRIDAQGQLLWGADGVRVANISSLKEEPLIVKTSDGRFVVSWEDNRTGTKDIFAQKFDLSGTKLWGENGTVIVNASGDQGYHILVKPIRPTDSGGIVIAWQDTRTDLSDIYVQKLDANGVPLWNPNGTAICTAPNYQGWPTIDDLENDSYIISWADDRRGTGLTNLDLYIQKINSTGDHQWIPNGTLVANNTDIQLINRLFTHDKNNIFIIWVDERADVSGDIYMQKFNESGHSQWKINGTTVANLTGEEREPFIVTSGGVLFVVWVKRFIPRQIYLMKYDLNGSKSWSSPLSVANGTQDFSLASMIPDGNGGVIITWSDTRNDIGDLYMLRLNSSGGLWTPSTSNGPPPPDNWWLILLTITLSITIPAGVGAGLAALFIVKRRRPRIGIPPRKAVTDKKLTEEEEKTLICILKFFSFIVYSKNR
ncbi:MAG: hypothetical protein ACTSVY_00535 [Candidatus Helarchaeota archaeon]